MVKKFSKKGLADIQIGSKIQMAELEGDTDLIKLSLSMMVIHASKLVPIFATEQKRLKTKDSRSNNAVIECLANILEFLGVLCNECNYDFPDEDELDEFEYMMAPEYKNDSILSVLNILGGVQGLADEIYIQSQNAIWAEAKISDMFEDEVLCILIMIKAIAVKNNIEMDDIYARLM